MADMMLLACVITGLIGSANARPQIGVNIGAGINTQINIPGSAASIPVAVLPSVSGASLPAVAPISASIGVPSLSVPPVALPSPISASLPVLSAPTVSTSGLSLPAISAPTVSAPKLSISAALSSFTAPAISIPSVKITLPSQSVLQFTIPTTIPLTDTAALASLLTMPANSGLPQLSSAIAALSNGYAPALPTVAQSIPVPTALSRFNISVPTGSPKLNISVPAVLPSIPTAVVLPTVAIILPSVVIPSVLLPTITTPAVIGVLQGIGNEVLQSLAEDLTSILGVFASAAANATSTSSSVVTVTPVPVAKREAEAEPQVLGSILSALFPKVSIPSVVLPTPLIVLPSVGQLFPTALPAVVLPSVVVPTGFALPTGLQMPSIVLPTGLALPSIALPTGLVLPSIALPTGLVLPSIDLPTGLVLPSVAIPTGLAIPTELLPPFALPTLPTGLDLPSLVLPSISVPSLNLALPSVSIPTGLALPSLVLPTDLAPISLPSLALPSLPTVLPSLALPTGLGLPTLLPTDLLALPTALPTNILPSISVPAVAIPTSLISATDLGSVVLNIIKDIPIPTDLPAIIAATEAATTASLANLTTAVLNQTQTSLAFLNLVSLLDPSTFSGLSQLTDIAAVQVLVGQLSQIDLVAVVDAVTQRGLIYSTALDGLLTDPVKFVETIGDLAPIVANLPAAVSFLVLQQLGLVNLVIALGLGGS